MQLPMFVNVVVLLFGMSVGSFLNVCIYRLPRGLSVIRPRSMCPGCETQIASYDNIPVISYLWLRGRCRHCGETISFRYPVVELGAGLFALAIYLRYGLTLDALVLYTLVAALLAVTFIDIDHKIIPNVITFPGIAVGLVCSFWLDHITFRESIAGTVLGGGILLVVAWGYYFFTKKEGMGGGDVKLLAMIGAFLGWKAVVFTIFVGSAVGTVVGVIIMLRTKEGRKMAVPFGPFLSLGALLFIFHGPQITHWYMTLMR